MLFKLFTYLMLTAVVVAFLRPISTRSSSTRELSTTLKNSFYDIVEKDTSGKDISFSQFKGKVVYGKFN